MIVGSEETALNELKELAPDLYNGVKERLLVETVVVAWEEYRKHIKENDVEFDDEVRVSIDEVTNALERAHKFYLDNPPK